MGRKWGTSQTKGDSKATEVLENKEIVISGCPEESVPRETHAASNMTCVRKTKANSNVTGTVLLHLDLDHREKTAKMRKVTQKEKSRREAVHLV